MADRDAVAQDMERIFGAAPSGDAHRLIADRRGAVAAWAAGAAALAGVAAAAWLLPASDPVVPVVRQERVSAPAAPPPVGEPSIAAPAPSPHIATAARRAPVRRPALTPRPTTTPQPAPTLEAPRLYGEALRRALAEDVIITRRLNREALERDRSGD